MRVETPAGDVIELGTVEAAPTVGLIDFSRRVTDDFGVTTVVRRGFARRMSVRLAVDADQVDQLQRQLADLRATQALWVADDRFASLSVRGYYKDFALDIPGEAISYCTLTIEGLALTDAGVDTGGDPAPDGATSTLRMIQPVTIGDAQLIDTNVPETDYPEWSADTTYGAGTRVMRAAAHRVYESAIGGNRGNDPVGASGKWLDAGPTNRWAMFDQALGTSTSNPGSVYMLIDITGVDTIALLDLDAGAVRVIADGYDRTVPVNTGAVTFFDLPARGRATVIVGADGQASVGTLLAGRLVPLGLTEASPTAGITDYSRKVVDEFGEVAIVQRAFAKKMAVRALISTSALDLVATRIAAVRATPALWIGQAGVDALTTYGFFKDYSVEVGENVSKLSLSIEGLSKAAPLLDPNAALNAVRDRLDAMRADIDAITSDGIITAGREKAKLQLDYATLIGGLDAVEARYQTIGQPADVADERAAAFAARDALRQLLDGYQPAWTDIEVDTPINAGAFRDRWAAASDAIAVYAAAITGREGEPGKDAPLVRFQWSINGLDGWHDDYFGGDIYQRQSADDGATWGPAYRAIGETGDGPSIVFTRSATIPATPGDYTGNPPVGWSDGPPAGTDFLWQSKATFRGRTQLTSWSAPVRISGDKGGDGTDGFIADSDTPVFVIECYSNGTPKPSWQGGAGAIRLTKGGGVITEGVTYGIGAQENIASLTLDGSRFAFAGLTADTGYFVVNAIYRGTAYSRVITVKKVRDGSAAFRSEASFYGQDSTANGGGNTTVPGGRTVTIAGSASYYAGFPGPGQTRTAVGVLALFWRNVTDNGPPNFLGEMQGSVARSVNTSNNEFEPEVDASPGQVAASFTFTSPTPDKQIAYSAEFRSNGAPASTINGSVALEITA